MAKMSEDIGEQKKQAFPHGHKTLQCVVVTPEKTLLDEPVEFVSVPLFDGELGVLPGRAPLVGRLGYGQLRTKTGDVVHRYFVDGGFVQVRGDVVTVLTNRAIAARELDANAAAQELEAADKRRTVSEHEFSEQQKAVARARGMIRVASHKE
jgi:F-type H+-transporting ATPase subunit epsilon